MTPGRPTRSRYSYHVTENVTHIQNWKYCENRREKLLKIKYRWSRVLFALAEGNRIRGLAVDSGESRGEGGKNKKEFYWSQVC